MPCSGLTQRMEPAPQRMDLGQGKSATMRLTASAITSAAERPGRSITANSTPSRSSSCSRASPVLRRKPSSACGGALDRGPLISSLDGCVASAMSRAIRTSRRGVDSVSIAPVSSPAEPALGKQTRQIVARLRLHAGWNLFRQELEEEIGDQAA